MWYTDKNRIKDFSDSKTANVRVVSIFYFVAFVFELLLLIDRKCHPLVLLLLI